MIVSTRLLHPPAYKTPETEKSSTFLVDGDLIARPDDGKVGFRVPFPDSRNGCVVGQGDPTQRVAAPDPVDQSLARRRV